MRCNLRLVPDSVDDETVKALERLLEGAKAGHVVGLAFVALHKGTEYSADATGDINNHPLLARGICRELEDVIARISR